VQNGEYNRHIPRLCGIAWRRGYWRIVCACVSLILRPFGTGMRLEEVVHAGGTQCA